MAKVNASGLKLYIMRGTSTPVKKLITEQLSFDYNRSTATIDVTSKDNNGYEEFIGGLKSGEVSIEFIMDLTPTGTDRLNYQEMLAVESAREVADYKAELTDGTKTLSMGFKALITEFNASAPMEDKITISMTLKRSGAPTDTVTP